MNLFRIGGGFRHGYWFVRELLEKAKEEEQKQLALIQRQQKAIFSEKLAWRVGKDGKSKNNFFMLTKKLFFNKFHHKTKTV